MNKRENDFKNKINEEIRTVLKKDYPVSLEISVQNENIIYENSPMIGSTAFGFILEAYMNALFKERNILTFPSETSLTNLSYDQLFEDEYGRSLINIKVEKTGVNNNAVAAIKQFHNDMAGEKETIDTRFYILKFKYNINIEDGKVVLLGHSLYNVDQAFNGSGISQDNRNWSSDFVNLSAGRMSVKNLPDLKENFSQKESRLNMIEHIETMINDLKKQLTPNKNKKSLIKIEATINKLLLSKNGYVNQIKIYDEKR